jgi:hypothetical protein
MRCPVRWGRQRFVKHARRFDIEWDDFSGGYWLGTNKLNQPRNTWQGDDVIVAYQDGTLMAGAAPTDVEAVDAWRSGVSRYPDLYTGGGAIASVWFENDPPDIRLIVDGTTVETLTSATINGVHPKRLAGYRGSFAMFGAYTQGGFQKIAIIDYELGTVTPVTLTIDIEFGAVTTWGDFIVAAYYNRLYFSEPGDPSNWVESDYYEVGDSVISVLVETSSGLLIGTPTGWFLGSGVLGTSFTLRRLNTTSAPVFPGSAVSSSLGTVFKAHDALWALNGSESRPIAYDTPAGFGFVRSAGPDYVAASCPGGLVIFSEASQTWRKVLAPVGPDAEPYETFAAEPVLYFFSKSAEDSVPVGARLYSYDHSPITMTTETGAFRSVSATLAEYESRVPFRVHDVDVYIDMGVSSDAYTRSVGVQLVDPIRSLENGTTPADIQTAPPSHTRVLPQLAETNGEQLMVRFGSADLGAVYGFSPKVTLEGVKLRRVVVHCEEM